MYPFIRLFKDMARARKAPRMGLFDTSGNGYPLLPDPERIDRLFPA